MFDIWLKAVARWLVCAGIIIFVILIWSSQYVHAADLVPVPTVTLQGAVADIIGQATSGIKAGVTFLQAEIPDVLRQLLIWKATVSIFWATVYIIVVFIGVKSIIWATRAITEQCRLEGLEDVAKTEFEASRGDTRAVTELVHKTASAASSKNIADVVFSCISAVVFGIAGVICFFNIWGHALTALQIWIAPKVWLIEYAASLVK